MISLAVSLGRSVGFRGAERLPRLMFDWLNVEQNTPSWTAIRGWLQRVGIAEMRQPLKPGEDLVIMFVRDAEQHLHDGERLPMSTEILESTFGLYKQLEGQHCKGGFTSLLACLPALLKPATPDLIGEAFGRVSAKDVQAWVKPHIGSTVTSRRNAAYAEHKAALKSATVQPAMV